MTVKELREKLEAMPQDLQVMYDDGEFGETRIWEVIIRAIGEHNKRDIVLLK